jgi:hypothetical protein
MAFFTWVLINNLYHNGGQGQKRGVRKQRDIITLPFKSTFKKILTGLKNVCLHKNIYTSVHSSITFNSQKEKHSNVHQIMSR